MSKTFKVRHGNSLVEIPELSEAEAQKYSVIGTAEGEHEDHCMYLAIKHGYQLLDRVVGYTKTTPEKYKVALTFYGQPTPREWSPRKKKKD